MYIETLYCCIAPKNFNAITHSGALYDTLSAQRKESVKKFLTGLSHPWDYWYRLGYRCKRVEVQIYPDKP
jgi:hypothetical protein